jgi:hypothetical protein
MENFDTFPTGKRRKRIIEKTREETGHFKNAAEILVSDFEEYTWLDSPLDSPKEAGGKGVKEVFRC